MLSRRRISVALVGLIVLVLGGWLIRDVMAVDAPPTGPGSLPGADSGLEVVSLSSLPPEAEETWRLIEQGGPFPYPAKDGTTFGNRESVLPEKPSGYYREYTVETPGSPDRGARRLVTGDGDELYYTGDHYASFLVVDPRR
ncbi:ribonuclease N [Prauserella sp. PE36]|uniref:Ribonuclease N n=1 Tax=Prauserella endophytica TaxID=1592324 RepID=A0ABY2RXV6_9PSEU|nr:MULTISPECIES: ribonuclease domain-containing protein [Prauserella]PXY20427.1 ribonuclease N [Prauserella coralliicola]RBM15937.1 ribonuclease N [Prauserella sp. PE36]TKG63117.1 ribonuclease N [Prauserella endophytica]